MHKLGFIFVALMAISVPAVAAEKLDSGNLFVFSDGTDIESKGARELQLEWLGRFGKRDGHYTAFSPAAQTNFVIADGLQIGPGASFAYHDIAGVTDLDDMRHFGFDGLSFETKYQVIDRARTGTGVMVIAKPRWSRIDATSGQLANRYGSDFALLADRELVPDRVLAALNLVYGGGATRSRPDGEWTRDSSLGIGAAFSVRVHGDIFVGTEFRYQRQYEGLAFNNFTGHGVFAGPVIYAKISERMWIAAGWSAQVAGRTAGDPAPLDLANFERHQAKVKVGYSF